RRKRRCCPVPPVGGLSGLNTKPDHDPRGQQGRRRTARRHPGACTMALPPLPELALFMALVLVLSLYGLTVSGHFPEEHRDASLRAGLGPLLLWGTIALCAALTLAALVFAWQRMPVYAVVLGGVATVLF